MADGVVQVAPEGSGKKIDVAELTRADTTIVERQRVAIGDGDDAQQASANVRGEQGRAYQLGDSEQLDVLRSIDHSLQEIKLLLVAMTEAS